MADDRKNLLGEIEGLGHQEDAIADAKVVRAPDVKAHSVTSPSSRNMGGITGLATGQDGTLKEEWNPYLPRPPSMRQITDDVNAGAEQVAVFAANTHEGSTMVKVLSEKGLRVVAAVRVFTSRNTKALIKLKGVTVKVADSNDEQSLLKVAEGCSRAFLVSKYWEKFDSKLEEQMAINILRACADGGIKHLVLSTFEDTKELKMRGRKSQLVPTKDGRIYPRFDGLKNISKLAKEWGVELTSMLTSFDDSEEQKRSVILIRGSTGRIVVQPYFQDKA
ncbi:MAG: hypothetical protein SGARI_001244 [Bacillariaceae sp.]